MSWSKAETLDRALDPAKPSSFFPGEDISLAVEVVSPDSVVRDRDTKPRRYAAAGIPHYWRVEREAGKTVVYVYRLEPVKGKYLLTGIHHDRLRLNVPFDLDIDLSAIGHRRG